MLHHRLVSISKGFGHRHARRLRASARRTAATAVALKLPSNTTPQQSDTSERTRTLTVLYKSKSLVPRILPLISDSSSKAGTSYAEFWSGQLERAYADLCPSPEVQESIRIAIYGCDEHSWAQELVSALLVDPFASQSQKELVHSRWQRPEGFKGPLSIQYGVPGAGEAEGLQVQSAWLQQFGSPARLIELPPPRRQKSIPPGDDTLQDLWSADIPVIVCNPATTPLASLRQAPLPLRRNNAILVLTGTAGSPQLAERVKSFLDHNITVLFVDPLRALSAVHTISSDPSSLNAVQRYQDNFAASSISALTEVILEIVHGTQAPLTLAAETLHLQTARAIVKDSFFACRSVLTSARHEMDDVYLQVSGLRGQMEELKAKVGREVFGNEEENEVRKAVAASSKDINAVMDTLTWWKLFWRVDDVSETVTAAVNGVWCRDLERMLVFHAGRLALVQRTFANTSSAYLSSLPPYSPFHSPVLQNSLSALTSSLSFPVAVTAFTAPLYSRREQLRFPTARLQTTAQRTVLSMSGSVLGGMSVAWAGWAGQLGIFDFAMQLETAVGVGMLGAVAGIRWAIGRYEKAKRNWWKDYQRVGQGLERDLRQTLDKAVSERVLAAPELVCSGLERLASRRKNEIDDLKNEVDILEDELDGLHGR